MTAEQLFRAKAPGIMAQLIRDFPITPEDSAAIVGNIGHECAGFTLLQEQKPTVAGSKGGYGWPQWTGSRRRAYEAYCKRSGKDPASDAANYAYLFIELKGIEGSEKAAIGKTVAAKGLDAKVEAFEKAFLRAGVKHYPSRKQWAAMAMDEWRKKLAAGVPIPSPTPRPGPAERPQPAAAGRSGPPWAVIIIILLGLAAAGLFFVRF